MQHLLKLLPIALLLVVGCRSAGPTVNPFLGSTTVPAQPTGAIGPGANGAPYYPPNVVPGQPSSTPPAGPYGAPVNNGQQWLPQGTGATGPSYNGQYVSTGQMPAVSPGTMYDPQVMPASATMPAGNSNALSISSPVSYPSESAMRVPTDNSPLVAERQQQPAVVQFTTAGVAQPQTPAQLPATVYNPQQGYVQTLLPAQQSAVPLTALNSSAGQEATLRSMSASQVYAAQLGATTVTQQQVYPAYQQPGALQPIPQYTPASTTTLASLTPTLAGGPTLAYGPTLASAQASVIRQMPAVEFTDLPPARSSLP